MGMTPTGSSASTNGKRCVVLLFCWGLGWGVLQVVGGSLPCLWDFYLCTRLD